MKDLRSELRQINPRLQQIKSRPILLILMGCFAILLLLIWAVGYQGQKRLEDIREKADENTRSYMSRLRVAIDIREAATSAITRARLYRASRNLVIPAPVYKIELNNAKAKLQDMVRKGEGLWGKNEKSLPHEEIDAWHKLRSVTDEFWKVIDDPSYNADTAGIISSNANSFSQNVVPPAEDDKNAGEEFYKSRTRLEVLADELSEAVRSGLDKSGNEILRLKEQSVTEVSRYMKLTILVGLFVSFFAIILLSGYLDQFKKEERLKQKAQGQLRSVFDSLSNDIVVIGEQGEVLEVNQAFLKHFNVSDAELRDQDYQFALAQLPEISSFVGETFQKQEFDQRQRGRIEIKSNNGHEHANLYDVSVSPLKVGSEIQGRVVVMDDVTEDERVREELRRSRTLSAVGQITAQVAHEIYNPLGAVKLNLELLEMQIGEDEDVKHTIGRLKRGVEHLSTIIMDLRYLTRPREPERKPTDLNKLLDEVVELASDRIERSRVCIARDYLMEDAQGEFDPQQLRKAFLNLLINAVEASLQDGEVRLRTHAVSAEEARAIPDFKSSNGAIAVSVIDSGVGMSAETKRRLFEAFYTTKRNGTGLGMMITQEIVKKHGGRIDVESEEGKGTMVTVYLPV